MSWCCKCSGIPLAKIPILLIASPKVDGRSAGVCGGEYGHFGRTMLFVLDVGIQQMI